MSLISLNSNNKNQYRRYPFKQGGPSVSTDGFILPDNAIVNCTITTTYGTHRLYVSQIFYRQGAARITLSSVFDDQAVGVFAGNITSNFTTLTLVPFQKFISGSLTIGALPELQDITRVLNFNSPATELEESVIFCYRPPAVRSIADKKGNVLRGEVNFGVLTNVTKTRTTNGSKLEATNPDSVFNLKDKSSFIKNCATPVIKTVNGVYPFPEGVGSSVNDGNIYIAGVKPVIFYGVPGPDTLPEPGSIGVDTPGITLDSLCAQKHKLLPPIDISGFTVNSPTFIDSYYSKPALPAAPEGSPNYPLPRPERLPSNFNATLRPEYYYWPQFVKEEYYSLWATPKSS